MMNFNRDSEPTRMPEDSEPARMSDRAKSRLVGLGFIVLGPALCAGSWLAIRHLGSCYLSVVICGPLFTISGIWLLIEAPRIPVKKPSPLGWFFTILALVAGGTYAVGLRSGWFH